MKKLAIIIVAAFLTTATVKAQHVFEKGDVGINAVLGFAGADGFIPSIEVSGEIGVIPTGDIGLVSFGGKVGYKYSKSTFSTFGFGFIDESYTYNQFDFGGRAAWHLQFFESDKWDAFAGVGAGLNYRTGATYTSTYFGQTYTSKEDGGAYFYAAVFVGGRMMISDSFGLYGEVGYSRLSAVRIGLTFKL